MFACLYDKNLKALGTWSTYATNKWSLVRKAYEFDELSITTREMENSAQAMYIGLHNDDGSLKYLSFSGKPNTKDGMTTYKGTDIRQIYKQQMPIDLTNIGTSDIYDVTSGNVSKTRLQQIYEYLLGLPLTLPNSGFTTTDPAADSEYQIKFIIDTSDIGEHDPLTAESQGWHEDWIDRTAAIGNVWNTIQNFNMMYDCYVVFDVNLSERTITCKVKRIYELISFKLSDFNESRIINDTSVTNRIIVRLKSNDDDQIGLERLTVYLLSDDRIVAKTPSSTWDSDDIKKIIQPARVETILVDELANGISSAYQKLMGNRFKGKVEINTDCEMGYLLRKLDLNTFADVYGYNAADDETKRRLPIMQISEDNTGKIKVAFGRLEQYWY